MLWIFLISEALRVNRQLHLPLLKMKERVNGEAGLTSMEVVELQPQQLRLTKSNNSNLNQINLILSDKLQLSLKPNNNKLPSNNLLQTIY